MSLPLLSWHVLSHGWCSRPHCRQRQHQRNKVNNASRMRVMILAQRRWQCQHNWWCQHDKSRRQCDKGDNADKVVNAAMECGYTYLRLLLYANWQHINVCKQLIMSYMKVQSSLRWLTASTMTKMHHFYSTSDHVPQNLSQAGWVSSSLGNAKNYC